VKLKLNIIPPALLFLPFAFFLLPFAFCPALPCAFALTMPLK
jgi:hypothetical protein